MGAAVPQTIRCLIVDDSPDDAELLARALRAAGWDEVIPHRVDTAIDLRAALSGDWDIVLCDWSMPQFDALGALSLLRADGRDIPLIIVSGSIGEDALVDLLKAGANDYVLKDRLNRLGPAVQRELKDAAERRARREAERSLQESAEQLRAIFESAVDGLVVIDLEGSIVSANPAAEALFGYGVGDLVGRSIELLMPPEKGSTPGDFIEGFVLTGEARNIGIGREVDGRRRDGSSFPVEVEVSDMTVAGARRFLAIVRDLSEKRRFEAQLLQAQKMEGIGRLAGGVAHDFNNLLTVILGYAQLGLSSLPEDEALRADLEQIQDAAQRAAQLTSQLLTFARRRVVEPRVVEVNEVVLSMDRLFRRVLGEDVDLVTLPGEDTGRIRIDPGQFEQVLMNLVINARDAMPRGGKLVIETRGAPAAPPGAPGEQSLGPGPYALVTVTDNGAGMTSDVRARIFEPFFTTKGVGKGTGLGLATSYGIVTQAGGTIWATSQVGVGSRFHVLVARTDDPVTLRGIDERHAPHGGETVLLIEDHSLVRQLAIRALRTHGYRVISAANGHEALAAVERHGRELDLLITDVVMPELSGREVAERVRAKLPELPVLFVSGYADEAVAEHGVLDEGVEFLAKPFTPAGLARRVREVLDARRPSRG